MKRTKITRVAVDRLRLNEGQLPWLPKNPRSWTQTDIDRMVKSIDEDPDFAEVRPVLATPGEGKELIVFAHNLLTKAAMVRGDRDLPVAVFEPETEEDQETIRRLSLKDNGSFGSWDTDILANDWDAEPWQLEAWGVPDWITGGAGKEGPQGMSTDGALSSNGKEMGEGYGEFVDKFKPKLTTDDCYTPPEVYDIVRAFVDAKVAPLKGRQIVRPFVPGGDFENFNYPAGCVVLDNPPFSIYAKIVRFYLEKGIDFFLFAPALTPLVQGADVTYVLPNCAVEYENGAVVSTSFVTNMVQGGIRFWMETSLRAKIETAQNRESPDLGNYAFPPCVWTAARLQKIAKGDEDFFIKAEDCEYIRNLDQMKADGKGLYGGGGAGS